jgi:hypothetical protein
MNTIYLEPQQVPAILKAGYSGRKFKARIQDTLTIPMDAGLWSGGTRETYSVCTMDNGMREIPGQNLAPWDKTRGDRVVTIPPGIVVIEHSIFCGKDMGLTFYIHPDSAQKLLPPPAEELTRMERIVLEATRSYKSSYAGMDRFQMAHRDYAGKFNFTRDEWNAAKETLIAKAYLNKAGAITTSGRNAVGSRY